MASCVFCSVMDVVVRANEEAFKQEENGMCELLEQIINEKIERKLNAREECVRQEEKLEMLKSRKQTVHKLWSINLPVEQIAFAMGENVETVEAWLAEA